MAKPSYDEVVSERDALREKVTDLETAVEELTSTVGALRAELESLPVLPSAPDSVPVSVDGSGWPLNPELQDLRGVKTPAYLRWLAEEYPEIWNAKCGGEPPQAD